MKEDPNILDLIERYHQGLLSEEETMWVEQKMQTDVSFAESVRESGLVNEVIHGASLDMLREKMTSDLALLDQHNKTKRRNWKAGAAIATVLLLGITSWMYYTKNLRENKNNDKNPLPEIQKETPKPDSDGIPQKQDTTSELIPKKSKEFASSSFNEIKPDTITDQEPKSITIAPEQDSSILKTSLTKLVKVPDSTKTSDPAKTDCKLSFRTISSATCKGEDHGRIEVEKGSVTGGKTPYTFYISTGKKSPDGIFVDLKKGNYIITAEDHNGCRASREVTVIEKTCSSPKSYSFNPDFGEIWKIPYEEGQSGHFSIYNRQGLIIFTGTFGSANLSEWNGTERNGSVADAGLYICILEYSNGKKEKIDVSIIR